MKTFLLYASLTLAFLLLTLTSEYTAIAYNVQTSQLNSKPWSVDSLDANSVYSLTDGKFSAEFTGKNVTVYVLDTGIIPTSEMQNLTQTHNFTKDEHNVHKECYNHGNMVSSIIAGETLGVAPQASIVNMKVIPCDETAQAGTEISDALTWILNNHPQGQPAVINMSLSLTGGYEELTLIIEALTAKNIPIFASAGNHQEDACSTFLPNNPHIITVAGYTYKNNTITLSETSNYGPCVDIIAPSQQIYTINAENETVLSSGTSMAAAYATAVAALYLQMNPQATIEQTKAFLYGNALQYELKEGTTNKILHY